LTIHRIIDTTCTLLLGNAYMETTFRLVFQANEELVDRIDDWRFAQRVESRSEAIRRLVLAALDSGLAVEPNMKTKS